MTGLIRVSRWIYKRAILVPLKRLFDPLKYWVKGKYTKILEGIGNTAKSSVDKIFAYIGSIFNSTFGKLLTLGKNALGLPFAGAGDLLNRYNRKAGYSSTSATMNFPSFPSIIYPSS